MRAPTGSVWKRCRLRSKRTRRLMNTTFPYDAFLSHSAKDKAEVRPCSLSAATGERAGVRCPSLYLLRQDGLKVWFDEWEPPVASAYDRRGEGCHAQSAATAARIEDGLEHSRVLVLCIRHRRTRLKFRSGPVLNFSDRLIDLTYAPACAIPRAKCLPILERHERRSWHARNRGSRPPH
jgi:hypothetical protein